MYRMTSLLALLALLAGSAGAAPILSTRVGGDVRWFDWREQIGGTQLLAETGPLATGALALRLQQGPVFAEVDTQWGGGIVRYDGHLQSGEPYRADADEEIIDTHWRVGVQAGNIALRAGLLQRDWNRFIQGNASVSSAQERYRWRLATLGGEYRFASAWHWRPGIAVEIGMPVSSHQKVYSRSLGDFILTPGDGVYFRLALPLQGSGNDRAWHVEPYYQQQRMGASDSVSRFDSVSLQYLTVYQPASVRRELGVALRWQYGAP